ncbi:MAG: hypothetical protein N2383_07015, partial [Caldilineales bacterium]|nr:hypothetical protein [Caldilineales bacterium]
VAHTRAEERLSRLEEAVNGLTAVQRRVEETVRDLAESMGRFETRMQRSEDRLNKVVGRTLEMEYREKAHAFFGRWLRWPRVVSFNDLWDELEAGLSPEEFADLRVLDLIVTGRPRRHGNVSEDIWLAVEVSAVIDTGNIERARRRAGLLQKAGFPAVPVVVGEVAVPEVEVETRTHHIAVLQDGSSSFWEEALTAWIPSAAA